MSKGGRQLNDRLLREIRDRLTAVVALLCLLAVLCGICVAIIAYWHVKADSARERLLQHDSPIQYRTNAQAN